MNAPAQKKRFSLTRLLGDAPPAAAAPELAAPPAPSARAPEVPATPEAAPAPVLEALPPVAETPAPRPDEATSAAPAPPVDGPTRKSRAEKKLAVASDERHSKKKRSYSVDMGVCDDLEVLAWYQGRSSSSVVEELVRQYLGRNRQLLEKAITVRNGRKDEAK